jgi:hypothetical protein
VSEPITGTVFAEYAYDLGRLKSRVDRALDMLDLLESKMRSPGQRYLAARIRETLDYGKGATE